MNWLLFLLPVTSIIFGQVLCRKQTESSDESGERLAGMFVPSKIRSGARPEVRTHQGTLRGTIQYSRGRHPYRAFKGIPYAKPPTRKNRFKPPESLDEDSNYNREPGSSDVRDASKYRQPCLQFDVEILGTVTGEEDCLYLNVFAAEDTHRTPVLVYFHGGQFASGGAQDYKAKYFMDHDIVLVTVNYRLGALGWLNAAADDRNASLGNMGLKDQRRALIWVHNNIRHFGGDPQQVTIFGHGAGGSCVHYHILSKKSEGLFHKAIMMSGNAAMPWALIRHPKYQNREYAAKLDCDEPDRVYDCVLDKSGKQLVQPHKALLSPAYIQDEFFTATIEEKGPDSFLDEDPFDIMARGDFNPVPVIMGITSGDGSYITAKFQGDTYDNLKRRLTSDWDKYAPRFCHYDSRRKEVSDALKRKYFREDDSDDIGSRLKNLTDLISGCQFWYPTHMAALWHASKAPVRLYYFDHYLSHSMFSTTKNVRERESEFWGKIEIGFRKSTGNFRKWFSEKTSSEYGAAHGDDVLSLFDTTFSPEIKEKTSDGSFSRRMVKAWVDFAKGDTVKIRDTIWRPMENLGNSTDLRYMRMQRNNFEMVEEPFNSKLAFWEELNIFNTKPDRNL